MPIGVLVNSGAVFIGGIIGAIIGPRLPKSYKCVLPNVFGLIALAISITLIIKVKTLQAIALALIIGAIIGLAFDLQNRLEISVKQINTSLNKHVIRNGNSDKEVDISLLTSIIILFCASGTGIYGAMEEGFLGSSTTLLVKSILDFFTAIIFGSSLGYIISFISIPQFLVYTALFLLAKIIFPAINPSMLADFSACGGLITLGAGLNILKITRIPMVNILPALPLVMVISYYWNIFLP